MTLETLIRDYLRKHYKGNHHWYECIDYNGEAVWVRFQTSNQAVTVYTKKDHVVIAKYPNYADVFINYADPRFFERLHRTMDRLGVLRHEKKQSDT